MKTPGPAELEAALLEQDSEIEQHARQIEERGPLLDWKSTVDDNTMPGSDLRMGYWVECQGGYYQQVSGNGGAPVDGRLKPYCDTIEQRMKMNSLVGSALDEYGSREAAFDGIMQVWVDGTFCYERTNFRWRRHRDMGIASWWMGMYHRGGPTNVDMHMRFGKAVLATGYIEPIKL
jgi:hypothetical protein